MRSVGRAGSHQPVDECLVEPFAAGLLADEVADGLGHDAAHAHAVDADVERLLARVVAQGVEPVEREPVAEPRGRDEVFGVAVLRLAALPPEGALGACQQLGYVLAAGVQLYEVLQVLASAAAVVVQAAHVEVGHPDHVELRVLQGQRACLCDAGGVDVGDEDDAAGHLREQLDVVGADGSRLAVEPHGLEAEAQQVDGIAAAAGDDHLGQFLLAALLEAAAQGVEAVDVVLRGAAHDEEPVGLGPRLGLVDLQEPPGLSLGVDVGAGLCEDGVPLRGALGDDARGRDDGLAVLLRGLRADGHHDLADSLPAQLAQVLGLHARAPGQQLVGGEALAQRDLRRLSQLAREGVAAGDVGFVH